MTTAAAVFVLMTMIWGAYHIKWPTSNNDYPLTNPMIED
jgi:hypothetical protein